LEAALFVAYNFHWDNLADWDPRFDFAQRVEKPANRYKQTAFWRA
jgi:hypothetical protein